MRLRYIGCFLLLMGCGAKSPVADMVLLHGAIYTVDENKPIVEGVAVKAGNIIAVGNDREVSEYIGDSTKVLDMSGKFVFPGFIDGHAHVMGIGASLMNVELADAKSYEEVIERVRARAEETPKGEWIIGNGWHQDKWLKSPEGMFQGFPTHHDLSEAVPDHPVWLSHASGHAGLANEKAMEISGISKTTSDPDGGEIFRDVSGSATGLFNETAQELIEEQLPKETREYKRKKLSLAIQECLENGLVGLHQAGSEGEDVAVFKEFAENGELKLRLHVMLKGTDSLLLEEYFADGPQQGLYNNHMNIRSIKLYADGALGSRGAWLLEDYSDAKGVHGHNITPIDVLQKVIALGVENGFQVCTHAIGDKANRQVLDLYEEAFSRSGTKADRRFRIEHAQHIDPEDIPRFGEMGVIPAMQAIHMSSDRPWAIDRLGHDRIEGGAYMWSDLIDHGAIIVNGTDAPVEPVDPLACFYASVSRKTLDGKPDGGFEPLQKMTREEALKSYTIWPAYGAFMEDLTGSIEKGKVADFTILDKNIMTVSEEEILQTQVLITIIDGEVVYSVF